MKKIYIEGDAVVNFRKQIEVSDEVFLELCGDQGKLQEFLKQQDDVGCELEDVLGPVSICIVPAEKQEEGTVEAAPATPSSPRLERWIYAEGRLRGDVYNHPVFEDGTYITTGRVDWHSELHSLEWKRGTKVQTSNTLYELGDPWKV